MENEVTPHEYENMSPISPMSQSRKNTTYMNGEMIYYSGIQNYIDLYYLYCKYIKAIIHMYRITKLYNSVLDQFILTNCYQKMYENKPIDSTYFFQVAYSRTLKPYVSIGNVKYNFKDIHTNPSEVISILKHLKTETKGYIFLKKYMKCHFNTKKYCQCAHLYNNLLDIWLPDFRKDLYKSSRYYKYSYMQSWKRFKNLSLK